MSEKKQCANVDCDRPAVARGMCPTHYQHLRRTSGTIRPQTNPAIWYCDDCTTGQRPGSYACSLCCGFTGRRAKVATGVTDAVGRPSRRLPE